LFKYLIFDRIQKNRLKEQKIDTYTRLEEQAMNNQNPGVEAFRQLVRYERMIKGYAYAILRDFQAAEDIYQDIAVLVIQRVQDLPAEAPRTAAWLRETTRLKCLEHARRRKKLPLVFPEDILTVMAEDFAADQPGDGRKEELYELMERCLGKLRGSARQVVEARFRDNRGCNEIAGMLGRTVQAVYNIIKRSRMAIDDCIRAHVVRFQSGGEK
jgi:RNA polymerase sigma factor (sigma-70 family)